MIEDEEAPDSPAVREIKRQSVILVFSIIGGLVLLGISSLEQADSTARARLVMRSALTVKRFAQWNADAWGTLALQAGTVYNRYRD